MQFPLNLVSCISSRVTHVLFSRIFFVVSVVADTMKEFIHPLTFAGMFSDYFLYFNVFYWVCMRLLFLYNLLTYCLDCLIYVFSFSFSR